MNDDPLPDVDDLDEWTFIVRNLFILVSLSLNSLEVVGDGGFWVPALVLRAKQRYIKLLIERRIQQEGSRQEKRA
jgi:hypothetical protein